MSAVSSPRGASTVRPTTAPDGPAHGALVRSRPALASVSQTGRDGVAHVARLLRLAVAELTQRTPILLQLDPRSPDGVSASERVRFVAGLLAAQARGRCDWLLFNHVAIAKAQRLVPARWRRPYAVFLHGIEAWGGGLDDAGARTLGAATLRISNSHFTARRMEHERPDVGPVVACPLALLPEGQASDGVDEGLLKRVRRPSALVVGRMSSAERYKGHDLLIEVWPTVRASVPGAQLVIAGGGNDELRLREKARAAGLADDVVFCGRVSDATLARLYDLSSVYAMPSRGEGFGIVYLEAMRAGRACVGCADDGASDVIADGETGFLLPAGDRAALASTLTLLLSTSELARRMGDAGRRRYEREFTFDSFRDRLGGILVEAFGVSGGRR